jgi:ribosomal protein L11 methyltransferase
LPAGATVICGSVATHGIRAPVAAVLRVRNERTSRPRRSRWLEASVRVPTDLADRVGTLLVEAGSQGVVTGVRELARGARARTHDVVRAYFPSAEPVRARLAVHGALGRLGTRRAPAISWRELDAQLWEMDWREHFQPVDVGRTLAVVPPWDRTPHPGRRRVVIHPGMAFGTGQHETTLSVLETIEAMASPPPRSALDVGTGTGILAIALAKLGTRRVEAIDTDPQALLAARDNVRRNRVGERVRLSARPLEASGARHPFVVANLFADVLVALAPTLAARVAPAGLLVTSGVLRAQQGRIRRAFGAPHWSVERVVRRGTWVTTVFRRSAA